ncbi:MAG: TSUP family transporter [Flavobacteriales bacterium]
MMYIAIALAALLGATLSFFSGFGLGTILLPAFLLFFPPPVAVACSAVVHLLNNFYKLFLVGKHADKKLVITFGGLSFLGSLLGALLLTQIDVHGVVYAYHLGDHHFEVTEINLLIGILIICFTLLELNPSFQKGIFPPQWINIGGLISGFFGGLSGHQGALRSAFLTKAGLTKEAMLGTRAVIATIVDITRISVYITLFQTGTEQLNWPLILFATLFAATGATLGNKWVKKTELSTVNKIVTYSLIAFGIGLGLGWI